MDGEGTYTFVGGRVYTGPTRRATGGQWASGHMSGVGKMGFPDGSSYEGCYDMDMKSGQGTFKWPDGRTYRGQWRPGKQHGAGSMSERDGKETKGEWEDGTLLSQMEFRL
mmetsp:Transcript_55176/g.178863  ORF Transcript_55176/g.178863 Transcript_55176/m.178863 type:complete len:110 (-) Transcript_55176:95-424(-)